MRSTAARGGLLLAFLLALATLVPEARGASEEARFRAFVDGRVGFARIGEDSFVTVAPGAVFQMYGFGLGLHVPLRFRVADEPPREDGVLRDADWDEVSDFTRILRFAEYGARGEALYVRLGELVDVSLGHGSLVHRYFNGANFDHYQTGIEARYDGHVVGGELMLDNVIDPNILGLRAFLRPLAFVESLGPAFEGLELGLTYVSDYQAPSAIRMDGGRALVTSDRELSARTEVVTLFGLDVAWPVPIRDIAVLRPYLDVGFLDRLGAGLHLGLLADVQSPVDLRIIARLEYRFLTHQYAASYVNSLYEIERYRYPGARGLGTKIQHLASLGDGSGRHGFLFELSFQFLEGASVTVAWEDYQGEGNSSLMARVRMPWVGPVLLQAYWTKRDFQGAAEAFDIDGALLVAEAQVRVWQFLYVWGLYAHQWHLVGLDDGPRLATRHDGSAGVGVTWEF